MKYRIILWFFCMFCAFAINNNAYSYDERPKCLEEAYKIANKIAQPTRIPSGEYHVQFLGTRLISQGNGGESTEVWHLSKHPLDDWQIEMTVYGCFPITMTANGGWPQQVFGIIGLKIKRRQSVKYMTA